MMALLKLIVCYAPDGSVDLVHEVPTAQASCVAIGGPNMDWLMVRSAKQGLSAAQLEQDKHAGNVFIN
jgi:L-arabinonolactonase